MGLFHKISLVLCLLQGQVAWTVESASVQYLTTDCYLSVKLLTWAVKIFENHCLVFLSLEPQVIFHRAEEDLY